MIRLAKQLRLTTIHRASYRFFSGNAFLGPCKRTVTADETGSSFFTKLAVAALLTLTVGVECEQAADPKGVQYSQENVISNWSATHVCKPARLYEPKSAQEVCRVLESHHAEKRKIRPIGTALSPNGIGMSNADVLSVAALDYIEVDKERMLVTVGAGTTVAAILKELAKHNLTLENFSSIQEQQIAGWTQVAAHGTGCTLPTVEEMIVRMKLATPTEGLLTLSDRLNPRLFGMAKAGLGCLGVVTELTLRCIPSHKLLEYTFTVPIAKLAEKHYQRLQHFRHVRYMWFPYTSKVCAVVSNPTGVNDSKIAEEAAKIDKELLGGGNGGFKLSSIAPTSAMCELLLSQRPDLDKKTVHALSFSQLRDQLLDLDPLDAQLVRRINAAEAEFWERSAGFRADDSTSVLGFDCGGEQWVMEVCFPIGTLVDKTGKDLEFVKRLLELIETNELPAPSPIEQRWTARSTSPMSPAYSINPSEIFSWVGVIMYLPPTQTDEQRRQITRVFRRYVELMRPLCEEYRAQCHWAKIEAPSRETEGDRARYDDEVRNLQRHLQRKYPVDEFNQFRRALDPHRILGNDLTETLFGR